MNAKAYFHGHKIKYNGNQWIYADTKKPITEDPHRACKKCGFGFKDYDACFGKLPGVINACCGHGVDEGYIQFENGVIIRGIFKVEKANPAITEIVENYKRKIGFLNNLPINKEL